MLFRSFGAVRAVRGMGAGISGQSVCIFGLGGAGRAILTGMAFQGASHISVIVRRRRAEEHRAFTSVISDDPTCRATPGVRSRSPTGPDPPKPAPGGHVRPGPASPRVPTRPHGPHAPHRTRIPLPEAGFASSNLFLKKKVLINDETCAT